MEFFISSTHESQTYQLQLLQQLRKHLEHPPQLDILEGYNGDLCNFVFKSKSGYCNAWKILSLNSKLWETSLSRIHSEAAKLGTQGAPVCRVFTLEELKEATNNFDSSSFMGDRLNWEGPVQFNSVFTCQIYKGRLENGTCVAIRSHLCEEAFNSKSQGSPGFAFKAAPSTFGWSVGSLR
uniref:Uncharacterized protein n=1 Tax=Populus alba TaxID=43335 RepID=A0A4U5N999_POPAL|nr:hypothetical protein D5086_0000271470 [Populus alba]